MTRLIIVRHAESAHNLNNRIQGHSDSQLTPKGKRQVRNLAARLKHFKIHKVYSSDLGRAYSTTVAITRHLNVKIIRDPKLREIMLGDWEGMTSEEVDELYDKGFQKWLKSPSKCRIPRAENVRHFRKRVVSRVAQIVRQNKDKTVLIVTHGGSITALLADWMQADFDRLIKGLQIENTSLTLVEYGRKRSHPNPTLLVINDTDHLDYGEKNDHRFRT